MAWLQYVNDYDELCPVGASAAQAGRGEGWAPQLYAYVKSKNVYTCPDDTTNASTAGFVPLSYAFNLDAMQKTGSGGGPINQSKFGAPSVTVLLYECRGPMGDPSDITDAVNWQNDATYQAGGSDWANNQAIGWGCGFFFASDYLAGRGAYSAGCGAPMWPTAGPIGIHTGYGQYLLADGHVKRISGDQVSTGYPAYASTCDQDSTANSCNTYSNTHACGTGFIGQTSAATNGPFAVTFSAY